MKGSITALYRYPIKGFTPEPLDRASLTVGAAFPADRLFAVEKGPSGFDPAAPAFIPKRKFAVLARSAAVATVRTRYDDESGRLTASAPECADFDATLTSKAGRAAFAAWLTPVLAVDEGGPYRLIDGTGWRFLDDPAGHISILNLASVRDLAERLGVVVDPLRFRANVHVEGWAPWAENGWSAATLRLGAGDLTHPAPDHPLRRTRGRSGDVDAGSGHHGRAASAVRACVVRDLRAGDRGRGGGRRGRDRNLGLIRRFPSRCARCRRGRQRSGC